MHNCKGGKLVGTLVVNVVRVQIFDSSQNILSCLLCTLKVALKYGIPLNSSVSQTELQGALVGWNCFVLS